MSLFKDLINGKTDKQTVFNHVYHQIILQKHPSTQDGNCLLFDNKTKCKCALGHLLSDDELSIIKKKHQGYIVGVGGVCMYLGLSMGFVQYGEMNEEHRFLNELRYAHDSAAMYLDFINAFKLEMRSIANNHKLTIPKE